MASVRTNPIQNEKQTELLPDNQFNPITTITQSFKNVRLTTPLNFVVNTIAYVPILSDSSDSSDEEDDNTFRKELDNFNINNPPFKIKELKNKEKVLKGVSPSIERCNETNRDIVPVDYTSRVTEPFLLRLQEEGFNKIDKEKLATSVSVSMALNRMKSLSERRNNSLRYELNAEIKEEVKIRKEIFGFFWIYQWVDTDEKDTDMAYVRKFYKQLKKKNKDLAKNFLENAEKDICVPYQWLREEAKNYDLTRKLVREFREKSPDVDIYLCLIDSDTIKFNSIFSAYLKLRNRHQDAPDVMTTGFEFDRDGRSSDFEFRKFSKVYSFFGEIDRKIRVSTAQICPAFVYYGEPNMCILILKGSDTVEGSFLKASKQKLPPFGSESPNILKSIIGKRSIVDFASHFVFGEDNPIITAIPKRFYDFKRSKTPIYFSENFKENGQPTKWDFKRLNQIYQSNTDGKTWAMNLFINGGIKCNMHYHKCVGLITKACNDSSKVAGLKNQLVALNLLSQDADKITEAIKKRSQVMSEYQERCSTVIDEDRLIKLMNNIDVPRIRLFPNAQDDELYKKRQIFANIEVLALFEDGVLTTENFKESLNLKSGILEQIFIREILDDLRARDVFFADLLDVVSVKIFLPFLFLYRDFISVREIIELCQENPPSFAEILAKNDDPTQAVYENSNDFDFVERMLDVFYDHIDIDDVNFLLGQETNAFMEFNTMLLNMEKYERLSEYYEEYEREEDEYYDE